MRLIAPTVLFGEMNDWPISVSLDLFKRCILEHLVITLAVDIGFGIRLEAPIS